MSKKKGKKHRALYKAVKPFIKDSRVLYGMLGAVGAGMILGAAFGRDRAGNWLHSAVIAFKGLSQPTDDRVTGKDEAKPPKVLKALKEKKPSKPFSIEDI